MSEKQGDIPEQTPCTVCGSPSVRYDPYYFKGWICGDHPAAYTVSSRMAELEAASRAEFDRALRAHRDSVRPFSTEAPRSPNGHNGNNRH